MDSELYACKLAEKSSYLIIPDTQCLICHLVVNVNRVNEIVHER